MARIGIDIDDTITNSSKLVREYVEKHENEFSKDKILSNRLDKILRGFFDHDDIITFFKAFACEMGNNYEVKENVADIIKKLKNDGHEIYIITARTDYYYGDSEKFCKEYLDRNNIIYDKVITNQLRKINVCKNENIDIMIDDGVDTCDELNSIGIKAYLFNSDLNKDKDASSERIYDWKEAYNKINSYLNGN